MRREEQIWEELRLLDRVCFAVETGNCIGQVVEGPDGWDLALLPRACYSDGLAAWCPIHGERYGLRLPSHSEEAFRRALASMPGRRAPTYPNWFAGAQEAARALLRVRIRPMPEPWVEPDVAGMIRRGFGGAA